MNVEFYSCLSRPPNIYYSFRSKSIDILLYLNRRTYNRKQELCENILSVIRSQQKLLYNMAVFGFCQDFFGKKQWRLLEPPLLTNSWHITVDITNTTERYR